MWRARISRGVPLVFAAGAVFLALGLIAVLAIEERPLRGPWRIKCAEQAGIADPQRRALIFGLCGAMLLCNMKPTIRAVPAFLLGYPAS